MPRDPNGAFMRVVRRARSALTRVLRGPRRIASVDRALGETLDLFLECRKVRLALSDDIDGALPPRKTRLVRAHVATCATCGSVASSLDETLSILRSLRDEPPVDERAP